MDQDVKSFLKWTVGIVGGLFLLISAWMSFGTVPAGFVGVHTRMGAVKDTFQPGLYFKIPWIDGVERMDVQTQKEEVDAAAASNDLQQVTEKVAINFHVNPVDAAQIFASVGIDYQARVIDPAIQESIKAVSAQYVASDLLTKREEVREKTIALLTTKLQAYGVNVDSLNIANFEFSKTFNDAIEAKVTAEQSALASKNLLEQKKYEAQQIVVTAEANAKAIAIQASAINSQGGADYVALQWIKAWQAGGSQVPQFITSAQGGNFLMDMNGLKK